MEENGKSISLLQYSAAITGCITVTGYGTIISWSSPALPYLRSEKSTIQITEDQSSWIASLYLIGFVFGFLLNPVFVDRIGRKWSLMLFAIPQIISWLMIIFAKSHITLYFARVIGGIGYGGGLCAMTIYMTEIGNKNNRGIFLILIRLCMGIGFFITMFLGACFSYQQMNFILLMLPVSFVIIFLFMPDSSYFLEINKKLEDTNFICQEEDAVGLMAKGELTFTENKYSYVEKLETKFSRDQNLYKNKQTKIFLTEKPRESKLPIDKKLETSFIKEESELNLSKESRLNFETKLNSSKEKQSNLSEETKLNIEKQVKTHLTEKSRLTLTNDSEQNSTNGKEIYSTEGKEINSLNESQPILSKDQKQKYKESGLHLTKTTQNNNKNTSKREFSTIKINFKNTSFWNLFANSVNRKALLIVIITGLLNILSGQAVLSAYGQQILTHKGAPIDSKNAMILLSALNAIACLISTQIIENLKRRVLLITAGLISSISLIIVGVFFYLEQNRVNNSFFGWIPIICLSIYDVLLSTGPSNIFYIYQGEFFANEVKSLAVTIVKLVYICFAFLTVHYYEKVTRNAGVHTAFWIFGTCCGVGTIFVYLVAPESQGRALEKIQQDLKKKSFFYRLYECFHRKRQISF